MTHVATGRQEPHGQRARSHGSPSPQDSRPLSRRLLLLTLGLALILWGCGSPGSRGIQVRHATEPYPQSPIVPSPASVRLVTYNIWGLPAWINGADPGRYARIARELEERASAFILLQEVWSKRAREAVPPAAGWSIASDPDCRLLFGRSGLVSLSRYPIVDAEFHAFRSGAWPDSLVHKGALKITVTLEGSLRLNVWNVHLQAGRAGRVRLSQIAELAAWVRKADNGQAADIIAGDFNCTPDSEEYAMLTQWVGTDAHQLGAQSHFMTFDGRRPEAIKPRTLDYVFVRLRQSHLGCAATLTPSMDSLSAEGRLSDHIAVEAELRLELIPTTAQTRPLNSERDNPAPRGVLLRPTVFQVASDQSPRTRRPAVTGPEKP